MADKAKWDERYAATELVWSAHPNQLLANEVMGLVPGRALDLACGEGRNALFLAAQGWQVTAIDFSAVGIDKARRIADRRGITVDFRVDDVTTMAIQRVGYDLVCIAFLHTPPPERDAWFRRAMDSVAPGGILIYVGHDPANIERGVGGPQDPALLPDASAIATMLVDFEIEKACTVERTVASDPGHGGNTSGVALDTLVRARRLP